MDSLYKREIINGIFFDENIDYPAGDDQEFNFKIIKKGKKLLFSNELYVFHNHPSNIKSLIKKWFNYGRYYVYPYIKHPEMINHQFLFRVLFIPIFFLNIFLSFIFSIFLFILLFQLMIPILIYFIIGFNLVELKMLPNFVFVHSIKQYAQLIGIFFSFFKI